LPPLTAITSPPVARPLAGDRNDPAIFIGTIEALFAEHGHEPYEGARRESVSALDHALQCAQLAEWAHAPTELVLAALLHDIGHFLAPSPVALNDQLDDTHEVRAVTLLKPWLGASVVEPVRLHVAAKRYLVRVEPAYASRLSAASSHSLMLQGGPMSEFECAEFEAHPYGRDAQQLRRWDEAAKTPGQATPPLSYYLAMLVELKPPGTVRAEPR
jgi:phosphonate degradation associated HDIG domain protein